MCMSLSVDVDRFDDRFLAERVIPGLRLPLGGRILTVTGLREYCASMRARGYKVFPSCDKAGPDGFCTGHDPEPVEAPEVKTKAKPKAKRTVAAATPSVAPVVDDDSFEDSRPAPPPSPDEADDALRFILEARRRYKWSDEECEYLRGVIGITRVKAAAEMRRKLGG